MQSSPKLNRGFGALLGTSFELLARYLHPYCTIARAHTRLAPFIHAHTPNKNCAFRLFFPLRLLEAQLRPNKRGLRLMLRVLLLQ